jgi:hypothetical protein
VSRDPRPFWGDHEKFLILNLYGRKKVKAHHIAFILGRTPNSIRRIIYRIRHEKKANCGSVSGSDWWNWIDCRFKTEDRPSCVQPKARKRNQKVRSERNAGGDSSRSRQDRVQPVEPRNKAWTETEFKFALENYGPMTAYEIGQKLGRSKESVRKAIDRYEEKKKLERFLRKRK